MTGRCRAPTTRPPSLTTLSAAFRTTTDESGYTLTYDYDALDRITRITYPDSTFEQFSYARLDLVQVQDRAGRQTSFEYDALRRVSKRTDPLNLVTRFQWCKCGDTKSLTDPMGRTTTWSHDIEGRLTSKQFADGSSIRYLYEVTTSRLRQIIDEKSQVKQYSYNPDDTVNSVGYFNALVPTPPVSFTYDRNYDRVQSMTDGSGQTVYSYIPIAVPPGLGAGQLASIDGPLPNDTIVYGYDQLAGEYPPPSTAFPRHGLLMPPVAPSTRAICLERLLTVLMAVPFG